MSTYKLGSIDVIMPYNQLSLGQCQHEYLTKV